MCAARASNQSAMCMFRIGFTIDVEVAAPAVGEGVAAAATGE
ncbi:hypothetical protein HaLaN_14356, partial [Haematococcus lacustris]